MKDLTELVRNLGFSEKAAKVYLACLEMGEGTIQDIARGAKVKRTTIYYLLTELIENGALVETRRNKKSYYIATNPKELVKLTKEKIAETEEALPLLEEKHHAIFEKPRLYFLFGPQGFKQIWDMIFASHEKEYLLITEGQSFLDFVKEKYILDEIITKKKALGIRSKQIISDSEYARKIVAKDVRENRVSKLLPKTVGKLPFTEVICGHFVAFISPRFENNLFVVEDALFAKTRRSVFEALWERY